MTAGGEPANDIMSFGLFGKYRISDAWLLGVAVDRAEYDFELPRRVVGIEQDPAVEPIDAVTESIIYSGWIERELGGPADPNRAFFTAGARFASPSVEDVQGPCWEAEHSTSKPMPAPRSFCLCQAEFAGISATISLWNSEFPRQPSTFLLLADPEAVGASFSPFHCRTVDGASECGFFSR